MIIIILLNNTDYWKRFMSFFYHVFNNGYSLSNQISFSVTSRIYKEGYAHALQLLLQSRKIITYVLPSARETRRPSSLSRWKPPGPPDCIHMGTWSRMSVQLFPFWWPAALLRRSRVAIHVVDEELDIPCYFVDDAIQYWEDRLPSFHEFYRGTCKYWKCRRKMNIPICKYWASECPAGIYLLYPCDSDKASMFRADAERTPKIATVSRLEAYPLI